MTLSQPRDLAFPTAPRSGSEPVKGTRIGVPRLADDVLSSGVASVFARFQAELAGLGATLVPYDRPLDPLEENGGKEAGWMTMLAAEALAIHAQFAGREHLHREDFKQLFNPMTESVGSATDYVRAQMKRAELVATWEAIFADHNLQAVIEPGATGEIWKVDEDGRLEIDLEHISGFYGMWSDTNFPVLMVPAGVSPVDGGPVGIQIIGLPYSDPGLLQIGVDFQAATGYHSAEPSGLHDPSFPPFRSPARPDGSSQPAYILQRSPFDVVIPMKTSGRQLQTDRE